MSEKRSFATAGPAPGRTGKRAFVQAIRVLSWVTPVACAVTALQGGWVALLLGFAAVVAAVFASWYNRFLRDYARSLGVARLGSLEVAPDNLVVRHAGVLAEEAAIPWSAVRAVCLDDGAGPGDAEQQPDGARSGPAERFRLPMGAGGRRPRGGDEALFPGEPASSRGGRGIPLLAPAPVVPNLLVLLDPPVGLPWSYAFVAGPFNPPRGRPWPARPLPAPARTAAFFASLADPGSFAAAVGRHAWVREAQDDDLRYLDSQDLAG